MIANDFWLRCVNARCAVVPVSTYSQYDENGNVHQDNSIGIRFAALPCDEHAVGPDYYVMMESWQSGLNHLYSTPEEAISAYEVRNAPWLVMGKS